MRVAVVLAVCMVMCIPADAVELLVKAKPHWKDTWNQEYVDKLSVEEREMYESRSQVGDIILVRPDGWKWGKKECLPNYVVISVPDIEQSKQYEESLWKDVEAVAPDGKKITRSVMAKRRRWSMPKADIESMKGLGQNKATITKSQFNAKKTEKSR